jgi:hypothetical protein
VTPANPLENWLRKRFVQEAGVSVFMGVAAIALGIIAIFLTFWLAYAGMWMVGRTLSAVTELIVSKRLLWPHWLKMLGAGFFIVLLFARHFKTSPWDRGAWSEESLFSTSADALPGTRGTMGAFPALLHLLRAPRASSLMVIDILETGPRLLTGSRTLFRQADALRHMDPAGCAWVLLFLSGRSNAVPRDELIAAWPGGDWPKLWTQLRLIDGLVFLEKGISLRMDLRDELMPILTGGQPQP